MAEHTRATEITKYDELDPLTPIDVNTVIAVTGLGRTKAYEFMRSCARRRGVRRASSAPLRIYLQDAIAKRNQLLGNPDEIDEAVDLDGEEGACNETSARDYSARPTVTSTAYTPPTNHHTGTFASRKAKTTKGGTSTRGRASKSGPPRKMQTRNKERKTSTTHTLLPENTSPHISRIILSLVEDLE